MHSIFLILTTFVAASLFAIVGYWTKKNEILLKEILKLLKQKKERQ